MIPKVGYFEKVSFEQFKKDYLSIADASEDRIKEIYDGIKLPKRATTGSAGYDFFAPFYIVLRPGETLKFPTGIRVKINEGWVLKLYPRSSLGFKYRMQLDNTVGIIDSDYYYSDNEGHMFTKITNDSLEEKMFTVDVGGAYMQGVFVPFGITEDDDTDGVRNGGFGSTDKN